MNIIETGNLLTEARGKFFNERLTCECSDEKSLHLKLLDQLLTQLFTQKRVTAALTAIVNKEW